VVITFFGGWIMTKTATVHAQQRWEYRELTRKTEGYLLNELNELGQAGWELVSITKHREIKPGSGEASFWTAFIKRPHVGQAAAVVHDEKAAAPVAAPVSAPTKLVPSEDTGEELTIHQESPDEEAASPAAHKASFADPGSI
jgi:hypothetical protein